MKMNVTYSLFFLVIGVTMVPGAEADPCFANKLLGKMDIRGTKCSVLGGVYCDRLIDGGWYKALHKGTPMDMPTTCVNPESCGTAFPIWLNGDLPNFLDGIVQRQACVRGLVAGDCCIRKYNISVKNCGSYNVYRLPYTRACDEAYCFGDRDCDFPVTPQSSASVQMTRTSSLTYTSTRQGNIEDDAALSCPDCKYEVDILAIVAGCLCSSLFGGFITFLVMYKCDETRGKVFHNNAIEKAEDPFDYNVFKTEIENIGGLVKCPADDFFPTKANTPFNK